MNKFLGTLGLCKRAGKIALGFDSCVESVKGRKSKLLILTSDISEKTEKNLRFFCDKDNVPILKTAYNSVDLGISVGKKCVVLSVNDKGFGKKILEEYEI